MLTDRILFYGGIALVVFTFLALALYLFFHHANMKKLSLQLDTEYGKAEKH